MAYPLDRWYVGALVTELTSPSPLARTLLGQKLVFFRDAQGAVTALEDRCVHRGLPLSMGQLEAGRLRCGYHGLLFNGAGQCVEIPGQTAIPAKACVHRYTVVEQQGLVWVWFPRAPGGQAQGEPPTWQPLAESRYQMRGAAFHYNAPWQLIHDNLLDLTHAGYVHTRTIGGNARMHSEAPTLTTLEGEVVTVQRRLLSTPPPPTFVQAWSLGASIDRWQQIDFHISHVTILAGGMDAGSDDFECRAPLDRPGLILPSFHAVTPETEASCHYLWMVGCNSPNVGVIDKVYEQFHATFLEDKIVIEAQHNNLQHFGDAPRISAHFDKAPTMARRIIERLVSDAPGYPGNAEIESRTAT